MFSFPSKQTAKSPMGMFPTIEIDNDLKVVDDTIRAYYELPERKKSLPANGQIQSETSKTAKKEKVA